MSWQLVINGPGYFDTLYDLPEGVTNLGRADENDIVLSGDLVSRKHARVVVKADQVKFEDLGSRNGAKVNGAAVAGSLAVRPGDILAVGENNLLLRRPTPVEAAATEVFDQTDGVRRFGRGVDIGQAVMLAKDLRDSVVLKVLDNVLPFESERPAPLPQRVRRRKASEADDDDSASRTDDTGISSDGPSFRLPVAWQSLVTMYKVAERLAAAPTLQGFLDETVDLLMQRVGATTAVVLVRHRSGVLTPAAVRHSKALAKGEVPVSESIVDAALRQQQAIAVADVRDDSRFASRDSVVLYDADQVLCVPIGAKAPFLGVLYVNRPSASEEPVEALLDISTAITQLLATGIQRFSGSAPEPSRIRRELERFYPPEVAERLSHHTAVASSHLVEQAITSLAVEVVDFDDLRKALDGASLAQALRDFAELFVRLVFSYGGCVDTLNASHVSATFGTPTAKGDDAIRAVRCAMALKTEWERAQSAKPVDQRFDIRVGLATGKAVVGTLRTTARLDACAVGEPVQLAQWLAGSAQPKQLLITGKTLAQIGARFDVAPLGERPLLGSRQRTAVFEVLDEDHDVGTLSGARRR